jgi:hypothetical protein
MDYLRCAYVCKFKLCVCNYFPYYSIHEVGSFKKEMVKASGFEPKSFNYESRILQLQPTLFKYTKSYKD